MRHFVDIGWVQIHGWWTTASSRSHCLLHVLVPPVHFLQYCWLVVVHSRIFWNTLNFKWTTYSFTSSSKKSIKQAVLASALFRSCQLILENDGNGQTTGLNFPQMKLLSAALSSLASGWPATQSLRMEQRKKNAASREEGRQSQAKHTLKQVRKNYIITKLKYKNSITET